MAPYYNPLNEHVQEAVEDVIGELADRYRNHESFAGIGLHIGGQTFMQMPGASWGFDRETMSEFSKSRNDNRSPMRLVSWVESDGKADFLAWRGRELAGWYGKLAKRIGDDKPMLLLTSDLIPPKSIASPDALRISQESGLD